MIYELARRLSTLKRFVGFVLAEAVIERCDECLPLKVLTERNRLAILEIADEGLRLNVKLIFNPARPPHLPYGNHPPAVQCVNRPPDIHGGNRPPAVQRVNRPPAVQCVNRPPDVHGVSCPPAVQCVNRPLDDRDAAPPTGWVGEGGGGTVWKVFSREEVAAFIDEVGDDNEIHQGECPVVPGFLLIETLLNDPRLNECKKIRLRFKHFTAVGENLYLTFDGDLFHIDANDRRIDGWILEN